MSSKRIIALLLCLVLSMLCAIPAAASEEGVPATTFDLVAPSSDTPLDDEVYPAQDVVTAVDNTIEKLSDDVDLESEMPELASGIMVTEDNQAPVANPQFSSYLLGLTVLIWFTTRMAE